MVKVETERTEKKKSKDTGKATPSKKTTPKPRKKKELTPYAPDMRKVFLFAKNTEIELEYGGISVESVPLSDEIEILNSFFENNYAKAKRNLGFAIETTHLVLDPENFKKGYKIVEMTVKVNGKASKIKVAVQKDGKDETDWNKGIDYSEVAEKAPLLYLFYNNILLRRKRGTKALQLYRRSRKSGATTKWDEKSVELFTTIMNRIDTFLKSVGIAETHCSDVIKQLKAGPKPEKAE
jgi:hypothetical protein